MPRGKSRHDTRFVALLGVPMALILFSLAQARDSAEIVALKADATSGDAVAQLKLARAYDSGRNLKRNMSEAAKWYEAAALQGNAEAENGLGSLLLYGEGTAKDPEKACEWFAKAAEQKDPSGMGNLGTCYDFGIGQTKDHEKAATLYEQAANEGDVQSMLNLGVSYWRGEGVGKDLVKGYMWLDLARFYTQFGANRMLKWRVRGALDAVSKEISPQQKAEADALSKAWDAANRTKVQHGTVY